MKLFSRYNQDFFNRYPETPLALVPFDPRSREIADRVITALKPVLDKEKLQAIHMGSTALGISGRGDIEIWIFTPAPRWYATVVLLTNHYQHLTSLTNDTAQWSESVLGFKVEVKAATEAHRDVNVNIMRYLQAHPDDLVRYEALKHRHAHSQREYYRQKYLFYQEIIKKL